VAEVRFVLFTEEMHATFSQAMEFLTES